MTEPQPPPADAKDLRLPRYTTPTWEVELLISGVAVFAMLQLPGWLDDRFFALMPRLDPAWHMLLLLVYFYGKSAALVLAVTFVFHLLLRARWIALVGIQSVYPDGILLDRLRMGPLQRRVESQHRVPTATAIERADNLATTVFALGVTIATILIVVAITFVLLLTGANLLTWLTGWEFDRDRLVLALFAFLLLPMGLAVLLDRLYGVRLAEGGLLQRFVIALLRCYSRIGLGRTSNRIFATLGSHGGERRMLAATILVMGVAIAGVSLAYNAMRDPAGLGGYALFPQTDTSGMSAIDPAHYDDQRDPTRDIAVPYVQAMVVTGPYLRLVVPYQPGSDTAALQRDCPAIHDKDPARRATGTLDCLQRLYAVTLDGKPMPALRYEAGGDPRTDRPALVAMIDVRALPSGRHELHVARAPSTQDQRASPVEVDDDTASSPWRIAFWR
jgi:hypothetical protein